VDRGKGWGFGREVGKESKVSNTTEECGSDSIEKDEEEGKKEREGPYTLKR
jgi:hypothetical protein